MIAYNQDGFLIEYLPDAYGDRPFRLSNRVTSTVTWRTRTNVLGWFRTLHEAQDVKESLMPKRETMLKYVRRTHAEAT